MNSEFYQLLNGYSQTFLEFIRLIKLDKLWKKEEKKKGLGFALFSLNCYTYGG